MKWIKQRFCKHKNEKQINYTKYFDGQRLTAYGKRCERCGKETWL